MYLILKKENFIFCLFKGKKKKKKKKKRLCCWCVCSFGCAHAQEQNVSFFFPPPLGPPFFLLS